MCFFRFFLFMFWYCWVGVGVLLLAGPLMVEQVCSDEGDGFSGARPDGPVWVECDDSLPPTCEF